MTIKFYKYQGTGNDFILIDDLNKEFNSEDSNLITRLCDRKFGIGSDGLLLLQRSDSEDFHVDFINPDGSRSFCGNGSRCAVLFAQDLGVIENECTFSAIDGIHIAKIHQGQVDLKMADVKNIKLLENEYFLDTGSPHHIVFVDDVSQVDVREAGRDIRYSDPYKKEGVNVNFIAQTNDGIYVRTYERGVEEETLSCGTGVTAAALANALKNNHHSDLKIKTRGGNLIVKMNKTDYGFDNIWLCGPAKKVFEGSIEI